MAGEKPRRPEDRWGLEIETRASGSKGRSQPEMGAVAFLILYVILGRQTILVPYYDYISLDMASEFDQGRLADRLRAATLNRARTERQRRHGCSAAKKKPWQADAAGQAPGDAICPG